MSTNDEDFKSWFCGLGTQYYIAGRQAAMARLIPVYGNLLHHAVEMFLKGALVDGRHRRGAEDASSPLTA